MLPKWDEKFSLHHEILDQEHKQLYDLAYRIKITIDSVPDLQVVKEMLNEFLEYTQEHFAQEEEFMKRIKYPDLPLHQKIHNNFAKDVKSLLLKPQSVSVFKSNLSTITKNWLINHTQREDLKIERWMSLNDSKSKSFRFHNGIHQPHQKGLIMPSNEQVDQFIYVYECGCQSVKFSHSKHEDFKKLSLDYTVSCKKCKQLLQYVRAINRFKI